MAGGYVPPAGDALDSLVQELSDLRSRVRELEKPTGTQSASTVAYLKALTVRGASVGSHTILATPGDSVTRWFDSSLPLEVPLNAPTGRILVTVGCGEASLAPGDSTAIAKMSFEIARSDGSVWWPAGIRDSRLYLQQPIQRLGTSLLLSVPVTVGGGTGTGTTGTVRAKFGIWSSSQTTLAEVSFNSAYLTVEVIDPL